VANGEEVSNRVRRTRSEEAAMSTTVVMTMMIRGLSGVGVLTLIEAGRRHVVGVRLDRDLRRCDGAGRRESS